MLRIRRSRLAIALATALFAGAQCLAQTIPGLGVPSHDVAGEPTAGPPAADEILELSDIHSRALVLQGRLRAIRAVGMTDRSP